MKRKLPRARATAIRLGKKFDESDSSFREVYGDEAVDGWVKRGPSWHREADGTLNSPFKSTNTCKLTCYGLLIPI